MAALALLGSGSAWAQEPAGKKGKPPDAAAATPPVDEAPAMGPALAADQELEGLKTQALAPMQSALGDVRYILEEIDANLPDPTPVSKGGPALRKRPKGVKKAKPALPPTPAPAKPVAPATPGAAPVVVEPDWVVLLKALSLTSPLSEARDETIARVELIRKVGARKSSEAADALLEIAFAHDGVLRDECGRNIRAMGDASLPTLIRRGQKDKNWKVRRYANYQLDRMDRAVPAKALNHRDDRLRGEILKAYGETRHPEAVRTVLAQTDAHSLRVRQMARWSFNRYISGKRPPVRKRKLKLPGGKESKKEHVWLSYRDIAEIALREAMATAENTVYDPKAAAADTTPALELAKKLYALYDARRGARWNEAFAKAQALLKAGDAKGAVDGFDAILANDPFYTGRREMAPAYVAAAEALTAKATPDGAAQALALYRKARILDPDGDAAKKASTAIVSLGATPARETINDALPVIDDSRRRRERSLGYAVAAVLAALLVFTAIGLRKTPART